MQINTEVIKPEWRMKSSMRGWAWPTQSSALKNFSLQAKRQWNTRVTLERSAQFISLLAFPLRRVCNYLEKQVIQTVLRWWIPFADIWSVHNKLWSKMIFNKFLSLYSRYFQIFLDISLKNLQMINKDIISIPVNINKHVLCIIKYVWNILLYLW